MQNQVILVPKSKGGYLTTCILELIADKGNGRGFICDLEQNILRTTFLEKKISSTIDLNNLNNPDVFTTCLDQLKKDIIDYGLYVLDDIVSNYFTNFDDVVYSFSKTFIAGNNNSLLILLIDEYKVNEKQIQYVNISNLVFSEISLKSLLSFSGVILCGGQSTRMKEDKAFKDYHGLPQYLHQIRLLSVLFPATFISVKKAKEEFEQGTQFILDAMQLHGPINGLFSSLKKLNSNIFLLGVDYPYLTYADILQLFNEHQKDTCIVCYYHSDEDIAEPLVALYFKSILNDLEKHIEITENPSIQKFIRLQKVTKIAIGKNSNIVSVDN